MTHARWFVGLFGLSALMGLVAAPLGAQPPVNQPMEAPAYLKLLVPTPDTKIEVDGAATKKTGTNRDFVTPPLTPGKRYGYTIKATYQVNGKDVVKEKEVVVEAGKEVTVDFNEVKKEEPKKTEPKKEEPKKEEPKKEEPKKTEPKKEEMKKEEPKKVEPKKEEPKKEEPKKEEPKKTEPKKEEVKKEEPKKTEPKKEEPKKEEPKKTEPKKEEVKKEEPKKTEEKKAEPKKEEMKKEEPKKLEEKKGQLKQDELKKEEKKPEEKKPDVKKEEPKKAEEKKPEEKKPEPKTIIVPYVPTPQNVVDEMLKVAGVKEGDVVYDLGCGDGRIVVTAVKNFKAKRGIGIDLKPERVKDSLETAKKAGVEKLCEFREGDVLQIKDLSEASVITMYLLPQVNKQLAPILKSTLKPGSRIVSHDFDMGDWKPEKELAVMDEDGVTHMIYLWTIPQPKDKK